MSGIVENVETGTYSINIDFKLNGLEIFVYRLLELVPYISTRVHRVFWTNIWQFNPIYRIDTLALMKLPTINRNH